MRKRYEDNIGLSIPDFLSESNLDDIFRKFNLEAISLINLLIGFLLKDLSLFGVSDSRLDKINLGLQSDDLRSKLLYYSFESRSFGINAFFILNPDDSCDVLSQEEYSKNFDLFSSETISLPFGHYLNIIHRRVINKAETDILDEEQSKITQYAVKVLARLWIKTRSVKRDSKKRLIVAERHCKDLSKRKERSEDEDFLYGSIWYQYKAGKKHQLFQEFTFNI